MCERTNMDRLADLSVADPEIGEWIDVLTLARCDVIKARMEKVIEERVGVWDDDTEPTLVESTFSDVALKMYMADLLDDMVAEGSVEVSGVGADGTYLYKAVE